ncbi:hypothetical protein EIP91_003679 [Steccherinum ochraceum]|uniref:Uncharacterized protein n=1 Tax=Steccherinum ochraceum TaxID=92696 RepID=A0A4R0RDE2_9APHY|nr:hypothetical protein EIP91_003679 [Steccherinum ochraceum]
MDLLYTLAPENLRTNRSKLAMERQIIHSYPPLPPLEQTPTPSNSGRARESFAALRRMLFRFRAILRTRHLAFSAPTLSSITITERRAPTQQAVFASAKPFVRKRQSAVLPTWRRYGFGFLCSTRPAVLPPSSHSSGLSYRRSIVFNIVPHIHGPRSLGFPMSSLAVVSESGPDPSSPPSPRIRILHGQRYSSAHQHPPSTSIIPKTTSSEPQDPTSRRSSAAPTPPSGEIRPQAEMKIFKLHPPLSPFAPHTPTYTRG